MKMIVILKRLLLQISIFFALTSAANSAAWTQEKGESQLILNSSYYFSNNNFDNNGNSLPSDSFYKIELNPFYEYGLTEDITIGGSTFIQKAQKKTNAEKQKQTKLTSLELFIRKKLHSTDSTVFSIQPMIKLPGLYDENDQPSFGKKQITTEIRFLAGKGLTYKLPSIPLIGKFLKFSEEPQNHFLNLEVAFRHNLREGADEFRIDPTIGIRTNDKTLYLLQAFTTIGIGPAGTSAIQSGNPLDYDSLKIQWSVVKKLNKRTSIQLAAFRDVWGKNTGEGSGSLISLWYNF